MSKVEGSQRALFDLVEHLTGQRDEARAVARKCWGAALLSADFGVPPGTSERGRFLWQLANEQPWLKEEEPAGEGLMGPKER